MTFGPTRVRISEPFGLFKHEIRQNQKNQVLVYPRVRQLPELLMPATQHAGTAQRTGNWADYPPETGGVREYAPGDAYGRIHWPLSQKHQQLMSKTFEQPLTADLYIVLDLDRSIHVGEGEESTLEYAVSLAASVAIQIHERGRRVGLIANDARGTLLGITRGTNRAHLARAVVEAMAFETRDVVDAMSRAGGLTISALRAGDSDVLNQVLAACALSRVITTTTTYGDAR